MDRKDKIKDKISKIKENKVLDLLEEAMIKEEECKKAYEEASKRVDLLNKLDITKLPINLPDTYYSTPSLEYIVANQGEK